MVSEADHLAVRVRSAQPKAPFRMVQHPANSRWWILIPLIVLSFILMGFSITAAQETATITKVPVFVSAGEVLDFTIRLDKAPNFDEAAVAYRIVGPDGSNIQTSAPIASGQTQCSASIRIPEAAPAGQWHLQIFSFFTGLSQLPLNSPDTIFEVVAKKDLIFPTSAEITVNPSQVQLLRTAVLSLQRQVEDLKATLASSENDITASVQQTLRNATDVALTSIKTTQLAYRHLSSVTTGPHLEQEHIFFDDLRINYEEGLRSLGADTFLPDFGQIRPVSVMASTSKPGPSNELAIQAALRPFERNEVAYEVVADTQSLTFDLDVQSHPAGASICYHRRGDACQSNPDPTDTIIKWLPYAVWMVQFRKAGYEPEEREHDPFTEPNHLIDAELLPNRGKARGRK